ncbi:MAG: DUF488 domain-containing protein [Deltaproteobacteria bacterium]|nr:DUF488 domain-containing protein [Deltaproteobacteria bacterium]
MEIFTIGFTKTSAREFFAKLKSAGIRRVVDVRLNNKSQLAGFAKQEDLRFFLEMAGGLDYVHEPLLAPTQDLLDDYRKKRIGWDEYEKRFIGLIEERHIENLGREFFNGPSVLLCSEDIADRCHRRLVVEYLRDRWAESAIKIVHL